MVRCPGSNHNPFFLTASCMCYGLQTVLCYPACICLHCDVCCRVHDHNDNREPRPGPSASPAAAAPSSACCCASRPGSPGWRLQPPPPARTNSSGTVTGTPVKSGMPQTMMSAMLVSGPKPVCTSEFHPEVLGCDRDIQSRRLRGWETDREDRENTLSRTCTLSRLAQRRLETHRGPLR